MHEGEIAIDVDLVRRLLVTQFPRWADLTVDEVASTGTVNAIYRLGADLCVRLPRMQAWAPDLVKERQWLPTLASRLPLAVPEPVADGVPAHGYPFQWAIYRWLRGETFDVHRVRDPRGAATDLARFVIELRRVDPAGAPRSGRDGPLRRRDTQVRAVIDSLRGVIDTDAVTRAWEASLRAPTFDGSPVLAHGDLLPSNLLVVDGRLSAVIDFGAIGCGDPAIDVIPAWSVFNGDARNTFREVLAVDDATWHRARGLALHQALMIIPYYPATNPAFVEMATQTVGEVLADADQ